MPLITKGATPLVVSTISAACGAGPVIFALVTNEWYVVESLSNSFAIGLSRYCDEVSCRSLDTDRLVEFVAGRCDRSAGDISARLRATQGLLAIGVVLALLQLVPAIAGRVAHDCLRVPSKVLLYAAAAAHITCSVLACVFVIAGAANYGTALHGWVFCGKSYCDFLANDFQSCGSGPGYSLAAAICGIFILAISAAAAVYSWVTYLRSPAINIPAPRSRASRSSLPPSMSPTGRTLGKAAAAKAAAAAPTDEAAKRRTANEPALPADLEGGDWEFDRDTGYFWSEERQLYFEPETRQFYDPFSSSWYNPDAQLWYRPLDENEEAVAGAS